MNCGPDQTDPMASYVAHLWRRSAWILMAALVAAIAAWAATKRLASERYVASANLLVKNKAFASDIEREALSPMSYTTLMLSDELLDEIRARLAAASGEDSVSLRQLRGMLSAGSQTVADTTVRRDYSPIISASVTAGSDAQAKTILDIWLKAFIEKYGSLLSDEARARSGAARKKIEETLQSMAQCEAERAALEGELSKLERMAWAIESLLAPAPLTIGFIEDLRERLPIDANSIALSIEGGANEAPLGLWAERIDLRLRLAASHPDEMSEEARRRLQAIEEEAPKLEQEVAAIRKNIGSLRSQRLLLSERIGAMRASLEIYAENTAMLALGEEKEGEAFSPYEGADIKVAAIPASQALPIGYDRKTPVALAAAAALLAASMLFIMEKYLREALRQEKAALASKD